MGPGDVLRIQLWGKENQNLELPVSRDGTISFPDSGPLSVAGLSFDEARDQINRVLTKQKLQQLRDQTIEEVKKLHNATINNEILNALTIQI